jgi:hypothetical protein
MRTPCSILSIAFDDDGVLIQRLGKLEGRLRFLPTVEIVRLFAAEPVGERTPDVWKRKDVSMSMTVMCVYGSGPSCRTYSEQ